MNMKVAISTGASGEVYAHFGRAPKFTFVTIEDGNVVKKEELSNPGHSVGSIPEFVHKNDADYMIAGGMGRRAVQFFEQYGIEVIVGVTGSVNEVIQQILDGTLEGGESLCSPGAGKESGRGVEKIQTGSEHDPEHHHH